MLDPGQFFQAVAIGVATAMGSTYIATKLHAERLKRLEQDVKRLAGSVEGPDGLQVKVALLEGR